MINNGGVINPDLTLHVNMNNGTSDLELLELNYSYVRYSDTVLHMKLYGSNVVSGGAKRPAGNATRLEVSSRLQDLLRI